MKTIVLFFIFIFFMTYLFEEHEKKYFKYLVRHKWFVFLECLKLALPFNFRLVWLGIIHDWRKFLPYSYHAYAKHFYGDECLPDGIEDRVRKKDFMNAMRAHMKSNKHHWSHWCFVGYAEVAECGHDQKDKFVHFPLVPTDIPWLYVKEMIADWAGAGKAIKGVSNPAGWYENMGGKMYMRFTEVTKRRIQTILEEHYG